MNSKSRPVWVPGAVIIGAGPSGLAVAACLKRKKVPFLIFKKESCLASLWKFITYDCLKLHLPKNSVNSLTKQQFIAYLDAYADHFSIQPMFGNDVKSANYDSAKGFWRVLANGSEYLCRWFIIETGESAEPALPGIDGLGNFRDTNKVGIVRPQSRTPSTEENHRKNPSSGRGFIL